MLDLRAASVLVTGGSGFIGAPLCRRLVDLGANVHSTSRKQQPGTETLHWHLLDLADGPAVSRLVESVKPKVIFHLASHVAGARERDLVLPTFHANLASTVYLLEAASRISCERFIQVGSLEEPDDTEPRAVPSSPYAAAKAAASAYGRMFHQLYQTPVVLARLFMVYGPDQKDLRKLIPYVILRLLSGHDPRLSSGTRPVDWVYVDDVVEGLVRSATTAGLEGQRVDLGSGELHTVQQVVEQLYGLLSPESQATFGGLGDRSQEQVRKAQVTETEKQLGWRPQTHLRDGLKRTVDWYREELAQGKLSLDHS